jgi:hypothetical protein
MLDDDLRSLAPGLRRHDIVLGTSGDRPILLPPAGVRALLAGASASGKSTLAGGLIERLAAQAYQFLIVDPEGDYESGDHAVVLGDAKRQPLHEEIIDLLAKPEHNVVANLLGVPLSDRPAFFEALLGRVHELRTRTGRPHWIVIDEAHHLMPASSDQVSPLLPEFDAVLLITVHPDHLARAALAAVDTVIATGQSVGEILSTVPVARSAVPTTGELSLAAGEAVVRSTHLGGELIRFRVVPAAAERRRHRRKYAAGELGEDKSFYFRGPDGRLNLRAQNLTLFLQLADGVDDETWLHHLRLGHYSEWFREAIGDEALADEAARVEGPLDLDASQTRALIRTAISYTLPA